MASEGEILWAPSAERVAASPMARFLSWVERRRGLDFGGRFEPAHAWSVAHLEEFWADVWEFYEVHSSTPYRAVLDRRAMPGAEWFAGACVNYAGHLLRPGADADIAITHLTEIRPDAAITRGELRRQVRVLATALRNLGIRPGDRVVSYMPNLLETAVAFMACAAIGAIWSSAAPEFGVQTVVDRFSQIEPRLLFAADGYAFGGKLHDRRAEVAEITERLDSLETIVWLPYVGSGDGAPDGAILWSDLLAGVDPGAEGFAFEPVPHDHPLWVVYSSGTTGLPKPIVHSHLGALLEMLVTIGLHASVGPDDRLFFFATTGWIMWNVTIGGLMTGASIVLFDGNPSWPTPEALWQMAERQAITVFGASPTYVQLMEKAGLKPRERFYLAALRTVLLSGSPATPETFAWFYRDVKDDLWVLSASGGTDIAGGGFVGGNPLGPVRAGEIQCRLLGHDVQAWNDAGEPVTGEVGELVCVSPIPSMPLCFWNDPDGRRYRGSYFEHFPGIWRHGDFLKITAEGGCYIYGRSDSTLNRYGVRIGTAEIYRAVEQVEGIADSLIVCCELDDGGFFMPLFITLRDDQPFDEDLVERIRAKLRTSCSPRHVPDRIYQAPSIPYTLTGKKMEVPVRKILMGRPPASAANRDAMRDPGALDYFIRFAAESTDYARPMRGEGSKTP